MARHRREHLTPPLVGDVSGPDQFRDQLRAKRPRLIGVGGPGVEITHEGSFNRPASAPEIGSRVWCSIQSHCPLAAVM